MIYGIIAIIIIIALGILIALKYFNLKDLDHSINTCIDSLNTIFDEKEKIMNELNKEEVEEEKQEESIFMKDEKLYQKRKDLDLLLKEKELNDQEKGLRKKLSIIDEGIEGLKDYYNNNVKHYNELYQKKLFAFVYKLLKLSQKQTFKIRKLEELEILKKD